MIGVGDLVRAKTSKRFKKLVLWLDDEVNDEVPDGTLLVILDSRKTDWVDATPEWEEESYYVMSPKGTTGWVGSGWVEQITSGSVDP